MRKRDIIDCHDMAVKFVEMANSILEDENLTDRDFRWNRNKRMHNLKDISKVLSNYLIDLRRSDENYGWKYPGREK